jgi:hypothetical protein
VVSAAVDPETSAAPASVTVTHKRRPDPPHEAEDAVDVVAEADGGPDVVVLTDGWLVAGLAMLETSAPAEIVAAAPLAHPAVARTRTKTASLRVVVVMSRP